MINKSKTLVKCLVALASLFVLTNCASIVSKSTYPLSIESNPSNANISITDKYGKEIYRGNTPAYVNLKAGAGFFTRAEYQVKFSIPGYEERVVPVMFKVDGWYFGNLLLGGFLGMLIIDPATGAMWKIENGFILETLRKSGDYANLDIQILDIKDVPESWKSHLARIN